MRLHRLEISAFGPFAGAEAVDFDSLAEHGLFLLNGPTGAGKTSILDAVCFALYGSLPGARLGTRSLKSHHAAPDAEPAVVLEFTVQGRRLEVRRTPEWARPSARAASGSVVQKASTHVRELVAGEWRPLTARNDEAAALLLDLLGMAREQFTRVVLLPQGEFASFLRAKAAERIDLLEKLFGTRRFADVEAELGTLAQVARAAVDAAERAAVLPVLRLEAEIASLAAELPLGSVWSSEAAEPDTGGGLDGDRPPAPCPERRGPAPARDPEAPLDPAFATALFEWADSAFHVLRERSQHEREAAGSALAQVRAAASDAARALEDARELAEARSRRTAWESAAEAQAERVGLLASHRAAAVLRAPLAEATRASREAERARADAAAALEAAVATGWYPSSTAPESGLPDAQEVRSAASAAEAEAAVLAERRTAETELVDLERELEDAAAALERHAAAAAQSAAEAEELGRGLAGLEGERSRLETDAASLPVAVIEAETAEEVVKAVEEHRRAMQEVAAAQAEHERRRAEALDAKESWLGLRERRLGQAAAELAARLSDSEPCPVCGSADHPDPAVGADDPLALVDAERIASGESEAAAGRERTAHEAVAAAGARLAAVDARGGTTDPDKAVRLREEKLAAVRSARAAETRLGLVLEQIDGVVRRREAAAAAHEEASARVIRGEEGLRSRREERDRRRAEVQTWRGGFPSVGARQADVAAKARTIAALEASLATYGAAAQASLRAAEALASALEASAFSDAAAARAALLPDADGARLEAETSTYQDEGQQLNGLFASAAVRRALEAERNGAHITRAAVEALRASENEAERRVSAADFAAQRADTASARRSALAEELASCLPELEAARSRHHTLAELARTVRGQGENERRMSLHSYVLAARLEQVATAATERLLAMSDGRFSLEHSDALAARGAASGLGLEIVDGWTGQRRDPSTLSGGETFMASLSLALGLADVVQHESGGIDIETLFVDEGFGSLDEQALEQVMDAIEGLRAGGRVVGLVSHVSELKQRIPAQIRVGKGRDGSRIESVGLVAVGP